MVDDFVVFLSLVIGPQFNIEEERKQMTAATAGAVAAADETSLIEISTKNKQLQLCDDALQSI